MNDSPLRIFTPAQLKGVIPQNLKILKKEILLEFQLSSNTLIKINGHMMDKNTVLELFDELDEILVPYLIIENHSALKAFFKSGKLTFLNDKHATQRIIKYSFEISDLINFIFLKSMLISKPDFLFVCK